MPVPANLPKGLQTTHDGLLLVGAAIGTDDFIRAHVGDKVDRLYTKLKLATELEAQNAHTLMTKCTQYGLGYIVQVTPRRWYSTRMAR